MEKEIIESDFQRNQEDFRDDLSFITFRYLQKLEKCLKNAKDFEEKSKIKREIERVKIFTEHLGVAKEVIEPTTASFKLENFLKKWTDRKTVKNTEMQYESSLNQVYDQMLDHEYEKNSISDENVKVKKMGMRD